MRSATGLNFGSLERGAKLRLVSEMGEGGVIFADGMESDSLAFLDGHSVHLGVAEHTLNLLIPAG